MYIGNSWDYVGFTFGDFKSKDNNIYRVSNGSRYSETAYPTVENKMVSKPGSDGEYYFGSYYRERIFSIDIAYDNVTELQKRTIIQAFSDRKLKEFSWEELPFKAYYAKVNSAPTFTWICFDQGATHRLYKGEGSIELICYTPFAHETAKYLSDFPEEQYPNVSEWGEAAGLLSKRGTYDIWTGNEGNITANLHNPGDEEADFILRIKPITDEVTVRLMNYETSQAIDNKIFRLSNLELASGDSGLQIDTSKALIQGLDEKGNLTSNLYEKYKTGSFFQIPLGDYKIGVVGASPFTAAFDTSMIYHYKYY